VQRDDVPSQSAVQSSELAAALMQYLRRPRICTYRRKRQTGFAVALLPSGWQQPFTRNTAVDSMNMALSQQLLRTTCTTPYDSIHNYYCYYSHFTVDMSAAGRSPDLAPAVPHCLVPAVQQHLVLPQQALAAVLLHLASVQDLQGQRVSPLLALAAPALVPVGQAAHLTALLERLE
jgi:hypothetical protein